VSGRPTQRSGHEAVGSSGKREAGHPGTANGGPGAGRRAPGARTQMWVHLEGSFPGRPADPPRACVNAVRQGVNTRACLRAGSPRTSDVLAACGGLTESRGRRRHGFRCGRGPRRHRGHPAASHASPDQRRCASLPGLTVPASSNQRRQRRREKVVVTDRPSRSVRRSPHCDTRLLKSPASTGPQGALNPSPKARSPRSEAPVPAVERTLISAPVRARSWRLR